MPFPHIIRSLVLGKQSDTTETGGDDTNIKVKSDIKLFEKLFGFLFRQYILLLIIIIGVVLRIVSLTHTPILYDGATYSDIGWGLLKYGTFTTGTQDSPAWGDSLIYPLYLSLFYKGFGYSVFSTQLASLIAGILAIFVVYITTADIFDKRKGLIVAAIIALNPWVIFATATNITENFLIIFLSLTLWALIKSSKDTRYLFFGGIFATLTLLAKTNIGIPLVIVLVIFFVLWQFYYNKKKILKDPYMIFFVVILLVGAFARYYMMSQMDGYPSEARTSLPSLLTARGLIQLAFQLPFHLLLPATYFLFFIPETYKAISQLKSRTNNLLILVLAGGLGLILLHAVSRGTWLQTLPGASERYFITFIVPTVWLFFGYLKLDTKNQVPDQASNKGIIERFFALGRFIIKKSKLCFLFTLLVGGFIFILVDLWWGIILAIGAFSFFLLNDIRGRMTIFIIAFLIAGIVGSLDQIYTLQLVDATDDMHDFVEEGDVIAIDSDNEALSISSVSLYLADIDVEVVEYDPQNSTPDYILSQKGITYENYTLLTTYKDTSPIFFRAWIYSELKRVAIDENYAWGRHDPIEVWVRD